MQKVFGNFKADLSLQCKCPHCNEEYDTTEHLISCKLIEASDITIGDFQNETNIELWKHIMEVVNFNLKNRKLVNK